MKDVEKPVCSECGQTARCFCQRKDAGFNRWDIYILWCETCRQRKTETRQVGCQIGGKSYPQKTACPFCGKPPEEHEGSLSFSEFVRLHRQREGENDRRPSPVKLAESRAVENTPAPQPVMPTPIPVEPKPAPVEPKRRLTVAPPPRAKTARRQMMGITKLLTGWSVRKIMALFTVAYTLVLGTLVFTTKLWDEAPVGAALRVALFSTAIVAAWMIICSVLIVRYSYKHYENPTPKPRVTSHEQHLPEVS